MRILIADKFPEKYVEKLKEICSSVEFAPDTSAEDLKSKAANINILVALKDSKDKTHSFSKRG